MHDIDNYPDFVANLDDNAEHLPVPGPVPPSPFDNVPVRRLLRAALGDAAIISLTEAAEWLPLGDRRGRRWLREAGIVRTLDGKEVVRWGDVLRALDERPVPSARRRRRSRLVDGVDLDEVEEWLTS